MGINLTAIGVAVFLVLAPAAASLAPQAGEGAIAEREIIAPADASKNDPQGNCRALQCGLLDQRAASRAMAIAAGATPAATSYPLSMFPALGTGSGGAGALGQSAITSDRILSANSGSPAVQPAIFSLIAPGSADTRLCIDNNNLLGLKSNCSPATPPPKHCEIFTGDRSPACGPGVPEPGTLLLLGVGLLGMMAVRRRTMLVTARRSR